MSTRNSANVEVSVIIEGYCGLKFNNSGITMNHAGQAGNSVWPWYHGRKADLRGIEEV